MRRLLLIVTAVLALLPAAAAAQTAEITPKVFDRQGDPAVVLNPSPDGSKGTVSFRICRPGAACEPASGQSGRVLEPGPVPAGTVFEGLVDYQGVITTDRTPPWNGRVRATAPPRVQGRAAAGRRVRPLPGRWAGGWGDEFDDLRLQACRRRDGTRCETLSQAFRGIRGANFLGDRGDGTVAIDRYYAGWYLQAADRRLPRETAFPAIGYGSAAGIPALTRSATVSTSPLVRIAGRPLALPRVTLRRRAVRNAAGVDLGTVRCRARCAVFVYVSGPGSSAQRRLVVRGSQRLRVARRKVLRPGLLQVRVTFRGHEVFFGQVRLAAG